MDSLIRRLFEVVPTQEAKHEPQLGEAKLRAVAPRLADDLVEYAGNVGGVFKAQVFAQRQGSTPGDGGSKFRVPDEELLQFDVAIIQEQRHGCHREIEGLERRL